MLGLIINHFCRIELFTLGLTFFFCCLGISAEHWNEPSLSSEVVRPIKPSQTSRAPVSRLLSAVKVRDFELADRELKKVESRATALRTLAGSCAERSRNTEGVR